jgi:hypothetical protein
MKYPLCLKIKHGPLWKELPLLFDWKVGGPQSWNECGSIENIPAKN